MQGIAGKAANPNVAINIISRFWGNGGKTGAKLAGAAGATIATFGLGRELHRGYKMEAAKRAEILQDRGKK